jgi:predicted nucleic acid-binding protein
MAKIVLDSSVLIKWIKEANEELGDEARKLLRDVQRLELEVHVPALLLYEIGNILLIKARLSQKSLGEALGHLETLPLVVAPPAGALSRTAARLGRELGVTFYDASFLALASELDCPFVTADGRLFERARAMPRARHLSSVGALV